MSPALLGTRLALASSRSVSDETGNFWLTWGSVIWYRAIRLGRGRGPPARDGCWRSSTVEQLICNQQVAGSTPIASSLYSVERTAKGYRWLQFVGGYPSGQRGQTVNLLAKSFEGSNPSPPTFLHAVESVSLVTRVRLSPTLACGFVRKMRRFCVTSVTRDARSPSELVSHFLSETAGLWRAATTCRLMSKERFLHHAQ